jgi:FkbM family methyltransferase
MNTTSSIDSTVGPVSLRLRAGSDAAWYQQRHAYEEAHSPLYRLICQEDFSAFLDIGSNYGFVASLAGRQRAGLKIVCIEADPALVPFVAHNLAANGVSALAVLNAVAGAQAAGQTVFSINPRASLDNRVSMPGWEQVQVPMVSLDEIVARYDLAEEKLFIKIDTQGYEAHVLRGFARFMASRSDWVIKMEFAPNWLVSQGTQPQDLLGHLVEHYEVAEFPGRMLFNTPSINSLFAQPIRADQAESFLAYVKSLNVRELGWVDLLVRPKRR